MGIAKCMVKKSQHNIICAAIYVIAHLICSHCEISCTTSIVCAAIYVIAQLICCPCEISCTNSVVYAAIYVIAHLICSHCEISCTNSKGLLHDFLCDMG